GRLRKTALIVMIGCIQTAPAVFGQPNDVPAPITDERDNLVVAPYVGIAIDSFAAGDINAYLNQDESGEIKERMTGGLEFAYRLIGIPNDNAVRNGRQFWIYGRTTHGVRSADVDCRENPDISICEPFSLEL